MAIQSLSFSSTPPPGYQEPIREASSKTTWKTHSLVVLSYLLIGIGIALACASVYMATMIHPMIAMASPVVPLALGILLRPSQSTGLFSTTRAPVLLPGQPLGIVNPNVNCWLNSALQMLFNASSYRELMGDLSKGSIVPSSVQRLLPFQSLYQLIRAFKNYRAELAEEGGNPTSSLSSASVRKWLSNVNKHIPLKGTQEDPMALFEELHNRSGKFLPLMQQVKKEKRALSEVHCISLTMQPEGKNSFTELFNGFFSQYVADSKSQITRWFSTAPKGFLVQAIRVDPTHSKIKSPLDFPMQFDLTKEQCREGSRIYAPDAFIVHEGSASTSGHYVAYLRRNGYWWHVNDASVTQVSDNHAKNAIKAAYIVHYAKAAAQAG